MAASSASEEMIATEGSLYFLNIPRIGIASLSLLKNSSPIFNLST